MSCFVVVYFLTTITDMYLAFTSKSKFQKDYYKETRSEHFRFQSASFVYAKVNESHPMQEPVIFRMKGKCTFLKRALSRFEI